ncbi:D-glycerate dehydrogenase [Gracilibacillus salitolerans]|uniref:D-glycerate dehydrogenase n=1 Tax=Gracilibacillus salitolerans TaxID=2663022 RepID=A0A5Q2TPM3_9BACI|nr:D-glycerate dehydrogenase [Gracilibacillus salitolerans]QGH36111.1 D-glycerate dehydrogenase [Gracilibacillus salitolerans]
MKPKIYVTRKIEDSVKEKLENYCEVTMWEKEDVPVPKEVLIEEVRKVEGLYCLLTETIDKEVIESAPDLKVISNMAVGFNNIDIEEAKKHNIIVTNTPEILTETTADLTFALLMATARRIVEAVDYIKSNQWVTWSPMQLTGRDVHGATLGIIGMGRIGSALARRAKGFNMNIIYHNRNRSLEQERELDVQYVEFEELLKTSDFICVMVPYSEETKNLISEREFRLMKDTSILVNTSRGGIVDEDALYMALTNQQIGAAGLDVFEEEPINKSNRFVSLPNVISLPHIGSASIDTRLKMEEVAAENLLRVLQNNPPIYRVV